MESHDYLKEAKDFQKIGLPEESLCSYERAFNFEQGSEEDYLEAAFIAFLCQDPGFTEKNEVSHETIEKSWDLMFKLLEEGVEKYPSSSSVFLFWKQFFKLIVLGENDVDYQEFVKSGVLDAYFYSFEAKDFDESLIKEKVASVKSSETFKGKYLASLLHANN